MTLFLSRILLYAELRASNELEKLYQPLYNALMVRFGASLSKKSSKLFRVAWFIMDIVLLYKFKATLSELVFGIERENLHVGLYVVYRLLRELPNLLFQDKNFQTKLQKMHRYLEVGYAMLYCLGLVRYPTLEYQMTFSELSFRKAFFNQVHPDRLLPYLFYLLLSPSSEIAVNWLVDNVIPDPREAPYKGGTEGNEWSHIKITTFKKIPFKSAIQKGKCPKCGELMLDPVVACKVDHLAYCKGCFGGGSEAIQIHV